MMGGVDLEMPKNYTLRFDELKTMLDNGVITESMIDVKVQRILQTLIAFGLFDRPAKDESVSENNPFSNQAALDLSLEAPVLVKNNGVLPLKSGKRNVTVLIGPEADIMPCGGGSGEVSCFDENKVTIAGGLSALGNKYPCTYLSNPKSNITAIEKAKAVVVAVGFDKKSEKENSDRTFALPKGQDDLILWACEHNPNVVVVVVSGGEVDMSKWIDKVSAVLYAWYDGQSLGTAVAKILSGAVNPSGRLPMTFPIDYFDAAGADDFPYDFRSERANESVVHPERRGIPLKNVAYTDYTEGIYVGYRYFCTQNKPVAYPFGYGLSYTSFEYSAASARVKGDNLIASVTVRNTGTVAGKEAVGLYVAAPLGNFKYVAAPLGNFKDKPARELREFGKTRLLQPGESQTLTFTVPVRQLASFNSAKSRWETAKGSYTAFFGADATNPEAEATFRVASARNYSATRACEPR